MTALSKRKCLICGTIFQPRNETHNYCSGGCRTKAHREKHAIPEPEFLNSSQKRVEFIHTAPNKNEATINSAPPKINFKQELPPKLSDIGVIEYIPNPAYVQLVKDYQLSRQDYYSLETQRQNLLDEIHILSGKKSQRIGAFWGGVAGAAVGGGIIMWGKSKGELFYLLGLIVGIPVAIGGIILGAAWGMKDYFGNNKEGKLTQAKLRQQEVLLLEKKNG